MAYSNTNRTRHTLVINLIGLLPQRLSLSRTDDETNVAALAGSACEGDGEGLAGDFIRDIVRC